VQINNQVTQGIELEKINGIFTLTTERIVFWCQKGIFSDSVHSCNLSEVTTLNFHDKLTQTNLEIHTHMQIFRAMLMEGRGEIRQKIKQTFEDAIKSNRQTAQPLVNQADDIPAQIAKLSSLKDDGILTDEEFQEKKKELLNRM